MSANAGFEGFGELTVSPDIAAQFARLDAEKREELYKEFYIGLGSVLIGPACFYDAAPPFTPQDITLRLLSEPTPKPTLRRLSVTVLSSGSPFEKLSEGAVLDRPGADTSQTALLMDHFIDIEHSRMRGGEGTIDKTPEGRWRMDKRRPTFLDRIPVAGAPENVVHVRRGAKFESEFFSLPLMNPQREALYLKRMLAIRRFLTPTFQEAVTLKFDYPQNNVTY